MIIVSFAPQRQNDPSDKSLYKPFSWQLPPLHLGRSYFGWQYTSTPYNVRTVVLFSTEKTCTPRTRMLFLTEGLLLRQLGADPQLESYQVTAKCDVE